MGDLRLCWACEVHGEHFLLERTKHTNNCEEHTDTDTRSHQALVVNSVSKCYCRLIRLLFTRSHQMFVVNSVSKCYCRLIRLLSTRSHQMFVVNSVSKYDPGLISILYKEKEKRKNRIVVFLFFIITFVVFYLFVVIVFVLFSIVVDVFV